MPHLQDEPASDGSWLPQPSARGLWVAVIAIGSLYVGSTLLTPLYPLYERAFGFSELVVSEIYAAYVVGNLAVLFFFGRLSDQLGRRRTALIALALTALSALTFLVASSTTTLFVARMLNGFAAGLGAGTLTAWIAELEPRADRSRASVLASAGNLAGLSFGAVAGGLFAQAAPWPLRSSYVFYLLLLTLVFALVRASPETLRNPVRSLRQLALRPRLGIPPGLRRAFVAPAALAFACFALGGFYAALAPGVLQHGLGRTNLALAGTIVGAFFGSAALTAALSGRLTGRSALPLSIAVLWVGLGLLVAAEALRSLSLFLLASLVAGVAVALGYRSSLQMVNEMAPESRRAELVSSYLLVCYCSNSLPVVGVGLLSRYTSAALAHRVFAIALGSLGVLAQIAARWTRSERVETRHRREPARA